MIQMILGGIAFALLGVVLVCGWLGDDWHGAVGAAGILALIVGVAGLAIGVKALTAGNTKRRSNSSK